MIEAATAVFLERGYAAAMMRAIAATADVAVPTVELWFGTKPRLLQAAVDVAALDVARSAAFYDAVFGWAVDLTYGGFEVPGMIGQWTTERAPSTGMDPSSGSAPTSSRPRSSGSWRAAAPYTDRRNSTRRTLARRDR